MRLVTIIGSHGYKAAYGGWDQLIINLAHSKTKNYKLKIINPRENKSKSPHTDIEIYHSSISGFGFFGLLLDYISIFKNASNSDTLLLLGAKGMPAAFIAKLIFQCKIVCNVGGIEWERPQYNFLISKYLKLCFVLADKYADTCILDNEYYLEFISQKKKNNNIEIISYGGEISNSLTDSEQYDFLDKKYYLSISRSIKDNNVLELCETFKSLPKERLVMISNLSSSNYGKYILKRFKDISNIELIDGLYNKDELDLVRRKSYAYIHTHSLCGSAPSLIEMIVCGKPILSLKNKQNFFTLNGEGIYFDSFKQLKEIISKSDLKLTNVSKNLSDSYSWSSVIQRYEDCF